MLPQLFEQVHFQLKVSDYFVILPCLKQIPVFNANSVDPDQTPHSAASDPGLYCLALSILWNARHK